jgi:hypothetical protein
VGDALIYVKDGKNVVYAIDVTASLKLDNGANLTQLWTDIYNEEHPAAVAADKSDLLYKVSFNGNDYVIPTEANTYEYTIRVKSSELTYKSGTDVFTATALTATDNVIVKHSDGNTVGTGTGSASDTKKTTDITTNSVWTVVVDGTEFTIKVAVQSSTTTVSYKGQALSGNETLYTTKATVTADDFTVSGGKITNVVMADTEITVDGSSNGTTQVTISTEAEDGTTGSVVVNFVQTK